MEAVSHCAGFGAIDIAYSRKDVGKKGQSFALKNIKMLSRKV
jgi:hypothetical protein